MNQSIVEPVIIGVESHVIITFEKFICCEELDSTSDFPVERERIVLRVKLLEFVARETRNTSVYAGVKRCALRVHTENAAGALEWRAP